MVWNVLVGRLLSVLVWHWLVAHICSDGGAFLCRVLLAGCSWRLVFTSGRDATGNKSKCFSVQLEISLNFEIKNKKY